MPEEATRKIVSDTGPPISLEKLSDGYRSIRLLYDRILIPQTVLQELAQGQFESENGYLEHFGVSDLFDVRTISSEEHLSLSIEEEAGREVAQELDVPLSGIAGQVLRPYVRA